MDIVFPSEEDFVFWRRQAHKHPEPGFCEFWTTLFIYRQIKDLPVSVMFGKDMLDKEKLLTMPDGGELEFWRKNAEEQGCAREEISVLEGFTGLTVDILPEREEYQKNGIRTLFRFDIDAVPVEEKKDETHIPYRDGFSSVNAGYCHACGHDGHISAGIGTVKALALLRKELKHGIRVIFQPAEEGVRGALALKHLCRGVKYALIGHIGMKAVESHSLVCGAYGFFATKKFRVRYYGKAAHAGAEPEKGRNALLAACCAVMNLHALPRYGSGETRVNVGFLHAGTGANVIAEHAEFLGEVRGEHSEICNDLMKRAEAVIAGAAAMYGTDYDIAFLGASDSAASDRELAETVRRQAEKIPYFFEDRIRLEDKGYGSDDACTLMQAVQEQGGKAAYCMLGTSMKAGHHAGNFDFDEQLLLPSCMLFVYTALELDGQ